MRFVTLSRPGLQVHYVGMVMEVLGESAVCLDEEAAVVVVTSHC
jgi:hypothetical protein